MTTLDEFFKGYSTQDFKCMVGHIIYNNIASEQDVIQVISGTEAMISDQLLKWSDTKLSS